MAPLQTHCGHVRAPAMITIKPKATRQPTASVISRSRSVHARIAGPGDRAALPHLGMGLLLPLIIAHKHDWWRHLCRSCLLAVGAGCMWVFGWPVALNVI